MKNRLKTWTFFWLLLVLAAATFALAACGGNSTPAAPIDETVRRIALAAENFTDENIYKYHDVHIIRKAKVLADEQDKLPDLPDGEYLPLDDYKGSWKPVYGPDVPAASCVIDLGQTHTLKSLAVYDTYGNHTLTVETGQPFSWQTAGKIVLNSFLSWKHLDLSAIAPTRYVRLSCPESEPGISELGLYGYAMGDGKENFVQPARERERATADVAFGVNAFVDDPIQVSKVAGTVREFHNLSFTYENGKNYFAPSANGAWDFDAYYKEMKQRGIDVLPCIQGTTFELSGKPGTVQDEDFSGNERPAPFGADPCDPFSYAQHAGVMFNYAARYGSTKVDPSRLNLGENQRAESGLGYLRYYENFNEQNKDWEGEKSYFSPYAFAAMCSADYDGHEGRLGRDYGLKNADPQAKLVMGGLVGRNVVEYVALMKFWFENNRTDKKFVPDVINLHYYSDSACPENSAFAQTMAALRAWTDANLPGVEIWVTEFGANIPESEISDPKSQTFLEAKGNATVRQFLLGLASGADRMTMFMLRDTAWGVYENDGLVTQKGEWKTKPAWHYVYGARAALAGTGLDAVQSSGDIYAYRFKDVAGTGKEVYCLWTPDMPDGKSKTVSLDAGKKKSARLTQLKHGYAGGVHSTPAIENGSVSVEVSARPVFVTLFAEAAVPPAPTKERLPIKSISGDPKTDGLIRVLFDEQDKTPFSPTLSAEDPFDDYEQDPDFIDKYPNLPELGLYPVTAVLDLGAEYVLTEAAFYDSYNVGDIVLYALRSDGEWEEILAYPLNNFLFWKVVDAQKAIKTRFIKVEKYNRAVCLEAALYGYRA